MAALMAGREHAAIVIQRAWRNHMLRTRSQQTMLQLLQAAR
jgi:hypothetical protein